MLERSIDIETYDCHTETLREELRCEADVNARPAKRWGRTCKCPSLWTRPSHAADIAMSSLL